MPEWGRTHPGFRLGWTQPGFLHLDQVEPATCNQHGEELVIVENGDLPESFDVRLRNDVELLACPTCFEGDDSRIDGTEVAKEIASEWDHYKEKFVESRRPEVDDTGLSFTFR